MSMGPKVRLNSFEVVVTTHLVPHRKHALTCSGLRGAEVRSPLPENLKFLIIKVSYLR